LFACLLGAGDLRANLIYLSVKLGILPKNGMLKVLFPVFCRSGFKLE